MTRFVRRPRVVSVHFRFLLTLALLAVIIPMVQPTPARAATITVSTTLDVSNPVDGLCSLREAITSANSNSASMILGECTAGDDVGGYDTITVPAGTYSLTLAGAGDDANASGDLDITSNIVVQGDIFGGTIISSGTQDRVFHAVAGTVTLSDLTIRDGSFGSGGGNGAGIYNHTTLSLFNSTVSNNQASGAGLGKGGGIYTDLMLTISNSSVTDNAASESGGGIHNQAGTVLVNQSQIVNNTATGVGGGGLYNAAGIVSLSNLSSVNFNLATNTTFSSGYGGGLFNDNGSLNMVDSFLSENQAHGGGGGGIFNAAAGTATISGTTVFSNTANNAVATNAGNGGGAYNTDNATLDLINSVVYDNTALGQGVSINGGGGVYNYGSATLTVDGCYLTRNRATEKGGGIYNDWMAGVKDTLLGANRGSLGGGIFNQWSLAITRSTFINNQGEAGGGGIYNDRDLALTESSLISNAAAAASGGGILLSANSNAVSIQRTTVASNTANTDGGGVYVGSTSQAIPITNTTVSGNFAGNDGGGIFFVGMNTLDLYNVTVAYNSADRSQMGAQGGGIYANGTLMTMNNTLVGNNTRWISGDAHADCHQLACTVTADNSLVENDGPSGNGCLESGGSANILGEDPVLAILTDNGGPTWTHGLRERSPAVDAGRIVNAPPIDQRGNSRPDGLAYDIGAFEGTVPSWARFLPALLKD